MKKISALLIMLMMLISISSLVVADEAGENPEEDNDNQDVDNETQVETEIMNNSLGAEIRLLQLQKALLKNMLKGEMAVEVLKGLEFNTTSLEAILAQMKVLLEEVKVANTSSNESVQIFVELKSQAKNLTTQFRETIKELLDDVKLNEIRERIREMVSEQVQNLSKEIQQRIRQFNRNQLYRLYGIIGEANNSFVNEYLNGNATLNQTKLQLCKIINQMTKEKKYEIFSDIKEDNIRKKIHAHDSLEHMGDKGNGKGKN
jgi:nicotinamide mononucleotide adenylyltransferase